jgi:hypothetical protein
MDSPFVGVAFHAIGGAAHGSFYAPLKRVKSDSNHSKRNAKSGTTHGKLLPTHGLQQRHIP